jgi:hypothetical protein
MVRYILTVVLCCTVFIACNREPEVIKSNVMPNLYLIKNTNKDNIDEVKNIVKSIVDSTPKDEEITLYFYKYTSNWDPLNKGTSYFINNLEDSGGFSSEELIRYEAEFIAHYFILKKDEKFEYSFLFHNEYR